ncbi:MAG TPA: DUF4832 domain-containing protein [Polyangiaceae bacterium]|nr:MAG: hypothetical protein BWY17_01494 [Deltaproteobacteria bacterium ADurb.Bin207]HNS95686.1 DUF4832 domain-containing protein [Polyangiaceae bacterium]HNZ21153.1 DUF4832 domain-containing protein [Polyangiaceae bacterium]HOD23709.1 DUF4832 domain-containing protein [Polyangiaceae bacterium]HOE48101.1 DUF4832 domain-containing protein [Polyangiaceae bacterium]
MNHRTASSIIVGCLFAWGAIASGSTWLGCSSDSHEDDRGGTWPLQDGSVEGAQPDAHQTDAATESADTVVVEPTEIDTLFANPGMGWQTFHHVATEDDSLEGIPSGSAYYRYRWLRLQPTQETIDLEEIQNTLDKARAAGQTLMIRVMTAGSDKEYSPDWLAAAGCKIWEYKRDGPTIHAPDLDDPVCWQWHENLLRAIATRFASEPDLQMDIGSVGLWGEWHFSSTTPEIPMPSLETRKKVVDLYRELFPDLPQQALIGDVDALAYATSQGSGWRADCLGDYGFYSPTWNHMDDMYRQHVEQANATLAWQNGPVAWETCYDMSRWVQEGYDVHRIFQYAVDMHGSFVNNKSAPLPEGSQIRQEIETLLRKLGYRYVLRRLEHPRRVSGTLPVSMDWDNVGVAPAYGPYSLAVRLTSQAGDSVVLSASSKPKAWLPGLTHVQEDLVLPASMSAGTYQLAVGIIDKTGRAVVKLAIAGEQSGWYPLSEVVVP